MPFAMFDYIQSVEIDGTLYVGGGRHKKYENCCTVMSYDIKTSKWSKLSQYSAQYFAMTVINNKLVLVGGRNENGVLKALGEWQAGSSQWTYPFPPMPTPRESPSVAFYKHWLAVAGGFRSIHSINTVEVLDTNNRQWYTGPSLPFPFNNTKSAIIGDTWYLLGGKSNEEGVYDVYYVSLEALVSKLTPEKSEIPSLEALASKLTPEISDIHVLWKQLPSLNCIWACPLTINGSLFAAGGFLMTSEKYTTAIQHYVPETKSWVMAGELPCSLLCTCIISSNKLFVIAGLESYSCLYYTVI